MNDDFLKALGDQSNREQAVAALRDWSQTLWSYRTSLVEAGFSPVEALSVVLAFQTASLQGKQNG